MHWIVLSRIWTTGLWRLLLILSYTRGSLAPFSLPPPQTVNLTVFYLNTPAQDLWQLLPGCINSRLSIIKVLLITWLPHSLFSSWKLGNLLLARNTLALNYFFQYFFETKVDRIFLFILLITIESERDFKYSL